MGKITGAMSIDEYGRRRDFNLQLLEFRNNIAVTGSWDNDGLHFIQNEEELSSYWYSSIKDKEFIITTRVVCNVI